MMEGCPLVPEVALQLTDSGRPKLVGYRTEIGLDDSLQGPSPLRLRLDPGSPPLLDRVFALTRIGPGVRR